MECILKLLLHGSDAKNSRGNARGYAALGQSNRRLLRDSKNDFFGLFLPSEIVKSRMSDLEALSADKR